MCAYESTGSNESKNTMNLLLFVSIFCWLMTISLIMSLLWLSVIASWSFNPRFVPKIQLSFLSFIFQLFWYSKLIVFKIFSQFEPETACILCQKLTPSASESNGHNSQSFDMKMVAQLISLPMRPCRSFYFFAGFVYPLLPLDLTGNKSESWNRIYACFTHILNRDRIIGRSECIAQKYASKLAQELLLNQGQQFKISDAKLRYMICTIMWELVFDSEPTKFDLKAITELTESISKCFTYNVAPDWSNRIELCVVFMKQIRNQPKLLKLQTDFQLTAQEMCTVIAMELFITPALEIVEVMSNLMTELILDHTGLIEKISCDSDLMRYAIIVTAHQYPVLQSFLREIPCVKADKHLTPCYNYFHSIHGVEIQTDEIAKSIKNESVIDIIHRYISVRNSDDHSSISEINTCMAFGKGQRVCKGKELAIKIITTILTTFYSELDNWCDVEISAGRKYNAFQSKNHRMYYFNCRCWIADIQYFVDKIFRRFTLQRFRCQL